MRGLGGPVYLQGPTYTPYDGLNLSNQKNRKFGVFCRQLEGSQPGSHSTFHYLDCYLMNDVQVTPSSSI